MKTQNFLLAILIVLIILNSGCNYYMVSSVQHPLKETEQQLIKALRDPTRYFVLHTTTKTYAMNQIWLDTVKGIISFKPDSVASNHKLCIQRHGGDSSRMRYVKVNGEEPVLTEVHLYLQSYSVLKTSSVMRIPIDQISQIDVISKDNARTTLSYIIGIGIPVIAIGVLVHVILNATYPVQI